MRYTVVHDHEMPDPSPRKWRDTGPDHEKSIREYVYEEMWAHDADGDGEDVVYFAFSSGTAYEVTHHWYITYEPEWKIHNDVVIEPMDINRMPDGFRTERDWIV
jgi:hypothetical protein